MGPQYLIAVCGTEIASFEETVCLLRQGNISCHLCTKTLIADFNRQSQEMERVTGVTQPLHPVSLRVYFYPRNHTELVFLESGPL